MLISIWFSCIAHISGECVRGRGLQWALVIHCRVSVRYGMQCGTGIWCGMNRHASRNCSRRRVTLTRVILTLLCVCGVYVRLCHAATFLPQKNNIQFNQHRYRYMESWEQSWKHPSITHGQHTSLNSGLRISQETSICDYLFLWFSLVSLQTDWNISILKQN